MPIQNTILVKNGKIYINLICRKYVRPYGISKERAEDEYILCKFDTPKALPSFNKFSKRKDSEDINEELVTYPNKYRIRRLTRDVEMETNELVTLRYQKRKQKFISSYIEQPNDCLWDDYISDEEPSNQPPNTRCKKKLKTSYHKYISLDSWEEQKYTNAHIDKSIPNRLNFNNFINEVIRHDLGNFEVDMEVEEDKTQDLECDIDVTEIDERPGHRYGSIYKDVGYSTMQKKVYRSPSKTNDVYKSPSPKKRTKYLRDSGYK